MSVALFFGNKPFSLYPVVVGGLACTAGDVAQAVVCLRAATGTRIHATLARAGNPLAWCDYLAVAEPYRVQFTGLPAAGRGAAGRRIAVLAFCEALTALLAVLPADPVAAYEGIARRAWAAFAADPGYVVSMARVGAGLRSGVQGVPLAVAAA